MSNLPVKQETLLALQSAAALGISSNLLTGFEKAFSKASVIMDLKQLLVPAVLQPFKMLMGTSIGFKTDKPDYSDDILKNCLIEAINYGVQVTDNQFNIIAGRAYITKEGFKYLLKNIPGLKFSEKRLGLPVWETEKVTVTMQIDWTFQDEKNSETLAFAFKIEKSKYGNIVTTDDNVTGKATRKTLKFLYEKVSGIEMPDGEATPETAAERAGLDKDKEIKNPLKTEAELVPLTAEEILTNANLTLQDLADYCQAENQEIDKILDRIVANPAGAIARISKYKKGVSNE